MRNFNKTIHVGNRVIGEGYPVFIIAEAGVAHYGDMQKAKALIDGAREAGADAVKFQMFKTDELIAKESIEWRNRYKTKELPFEAFVELERYSKKQGILFMVTAHDETSLKFIDMLDVPILKVGSGEVSNWHFLAKVAEKNKPIILSTGMYTLSDISAALAAIAQTGNHNVIVLHCVTSYPTIPRDVNLRAIDTIRETFGVSVGYSDHTQGFHFLLAAVTRGACVIEKHIALDFNVPNSQDWKVACDIKSFTHMVTCIREIEAGLGPGIKAPSEAELKSLQWARKSLAAATTIMNNEVITPDKLCAKRPGTGIKPSEINNIIGRRAKGNIEADALIRWEQIQ